jgi:hypothetical protein
LLNLHDKCGDDDYHPTKSTAYPLARVEVGCEHHSRNGTPEADLNTTNDCMCFVTVPTLESWSILGEHEVGKQDEGFGTLGTGVSKQIGSKWYK